MSGLKLCRKRLKIILIREPRLNISTLVTKFLNGIQGGKTHEMLEIILRGGESVLSSQIFLFKKKMIYATPVN